MATLWDVLKDNLREKDVIVCDPLGSAILSQPSIHTGHYAMAGEDPRDCFADDLLDSVPFDCPIRNISRARCEQTYAYLDVRVTRVQDTGDFLIVYLSGEKPYYDGDHETHYSLEDLKREFNEFAEEDPEAFEDCTFADYLREITGKNGSVERLF